MKKLLLFNMLMFAAYLSQAQWQSDVRLTNDPNHSYPSFNNNAKAIAANGDTLRVVWAEDRDVLWQIYYKISTDGGLTWGADTRLITPADSWDPSIAVINSVVHIVWADDRDGNDEIYYNHSTDGGSTWGTDIRLTNAMDESESPSMMVKDSVIHVVWFDKRNATGLWDYDIYYKRSTDGGLTWGADQRLTNNPSYSGYPGIVVSGSVIHVVWADDRDDTTGNNLDEIYYKRSADGGMTWGPDTRLTNNPEDSWHPCISLNDSIIHVVWEDARDGNYEIYYKRSTDRGLTWGADIRLSNAIGYSELPTIAVSGSNVHVVWGDTRDGSGGSEIYYKLSEDAGLTWGIDTRLTNASAESWDPFIALSDSVIHLVWNDTRDGNWEIYYKRNPTGNIPVGIGNDLWGRSGQQISIWPNPASTTIHISLNTISNDKTLLSIRSILGEELLSKQIQNSESIIDVSNLQNGLYFVVIKTSNKQTVSTKLIIQK